MDPSKDVSDLHNFVLFLMKMIVTVFNTAVNKHINVQGSMTLKNCIDV